MTLRRIQGSSPFEAQVGYARAVSDGRYVFVSGTTGFNYDTMEIDSEVSTQADQALRNIETALLEAGSTIAHVTRVRYILPRREDFELCWPTLRRWFGDAPPAATMLVADLMDPRMKIEIEATALLANASD